jgi:hypothetical protein
MYEEADFVTWSFNRGKSAIPYTLKKNRGFTHLSRKQHKEQREHQKEEINCIFIILQFFQYFFGITLLR